MKIPKLSRGLNGNIATSIAIISFFLFGLVIMGVLNVYLSRESQDTRTRAQELSPIQETKCINAGGECQRGKLNEVGKPCSLTDKTPGSVAYNYCPTQEGDVRCCVPNAPVDPGDNLAGYSASLTVRLSGIGPNASILNSTRTTTIKIFSNSGTLDSADYAATDILTYDSESGNFVNENFNLGELPPGEYQMVIQIPTYLDEQLLTREGSGVFSMTAGADVEAAAVTMRAGDLAPGDRGDNTVDILDYNLLLGCMPEAPPGACLNRDRADLNDDGAVDRRDMDILLENYNDKGFAFKTDKFQCVQDPKCESGRDSLQLCSLICTRVSRRS